MKLFSGKGRTPAFENFASRRPLAHLGAEIGAANRLSHRAGFEAMVGKGQGPQFTAAIRDTQSFADFRARQAGAPRGLSRFFRREGGWFKGEKS
jgi:hypothetical protein